MLNTRSTYVQYNGALTKTAKERAKINRRFAFLKTASEYARFFHAQDQISLPSTKH